MVICSVISSVLPAPPKQQTPSFPLVLQAVWIVRTRPLSLQFLLEGRGS